MIKKVGVLFVHGMGTFYDDFAHDTIQELRNRLSGRGLNRDEVAWESVYWAPVLSARESQLWVDSSTDHDLNWAKLRKFFINAFGNVAAYESSMGRPEGVYHQVHDLIHAALVNLSGKLAGDQPLIVVAHSFGSVMMSNYIWDRQRGRDAERYGATPFERLESLCGMVTLGSSLPLFALGHSPVACIQFPPAGLPERWRRKAKWINLYDSDDVLGWPLRPVSMSYAETVAEDIEVSVGNILTSWNPGNHTAYWTDDSVIKPLAYLLSDVLEESQS